MYSINFLDALKTKRILSFEEILKKEEEFRSFTISEREKLWEDLHVYFKNSSLSDDQFFWWSYFRWYTELSWKFFSNRDHDFISTVAIPRQMIMATLLEFDVWRELLWYLNNRYFEEDEMENFYSNLQDKLFSSSVKIGKINNQEVTIASFVKDLILANQQKNTLRLAELSSSLENMLFPDDEKLDQYFDHFIFVEPDDAVSNIINFIHFLLGVKPDKIKSVVEVLIHEEKYELLLKAQNEKEGNGQTFENQLEKITASIPNKTTINPVPPQVQVVDSGKKIETQTQSFSSSLTTQQQTKTPLKTEVANRIRPSNQDIKKMVDQVFSPSSTVDFKGILTMLDTLAEKYNDDSICELYIFNEETGNFEWVNV